jgi:hypothetical protein
MLEISVGVEFWTKGLGMLRKHMFFVACIQYFNEVDIVIRRFKMSILLRCSNHAFYLNRVCQLGQGHTQGC